MCTLIRHKICESPVKLLLPNTKAVHFCDIIFRYMAMSFRPAQTKCLKSKIELRQVKLG